MYGTFLGVRLDLDPGPGVCTVAEAACWLLGRMSCLIYRTCALLLMTDRLLPEFVDKCVAGPFHLSFSSSWFLSHEILLQRFI